LIAHSTPDERFAIFVHEATWKLLTTEAGLNATDLCALPERVYATCQALGLLRQAPGQFFLEFCHQSHPTNAPLAMTRTTPVDVSPERGSGQWVERAIVIFRESFLEELVQRDSKAGRNLPMRRLYTRIALAHEMAHLFATDEFSGPFNGMGYARLERLTDAIAFQAFESELLSTPVEARTEFIRCFPYILGFIRVALKFSPEGEDLVKLAQMVAAEMVREGQNFKGLARPSETGIALGAPSME
jgi:hypothetical protein